MEDSLLKVSERIRYILTLLWSYSLGLIPSIIKGFCLWGKMGEKAKHRIFEEIFLLSIWTVFAAFILVQLLDISYWYTTLFLWLSFCAGGACCLHGIMMYIINHEE